MRSLKYKNIVKYKEKCKKIVKNPIFYDIIIVAKNPNISSKERIFTMINYNTFAHNLKRGILNFSERISRRLSRPDFKFVSQMIYGILTSQSCHLSQIARVLNERISLKKTIDRLSRNLSTFYADEQLLEDYIEKNKNNFTDKTILIIDGSDVIKPCSPKMECISRVRDGSTGEYGEGYHTLGVTALTPEKKMPVGVYTRVYSPTEKGFASEDDEVLKALKFLGKHFKKSNIRAFDRGYDANVYYEHLLKNKEKFIIRAKKNRDIIYKCERTNILTVARKFKGKYILKFMKKNGVKTNCKISIIPIKLPCKPNDDLNLIVCYGLGKEPLMLITNLKSNDDRLPVAVTKIYLMRWRIEEFYRFKKQQFGFEDFRVRSIRSIRNIDLLLTIAIGYIGIISEKHDKRRIVMELINISKRIYGMPKFVFYAIADGLFTVLAKCKQGVSDMLQKPPKTTQLSFITDTGFRSA